MIAMRYLPHTQEDITEMLAKTGHASLDDLFESIPEACRMKGELDLPDPVTEWELDARMDRLASQNAAFPEQKIFIGAGSYPHHIPAFIPYVISRSEFATAYTPYQPEISQGTLQGIYEFQTMITDLLGTQVATASHYDCGTALAEALLIGLKKKKKLNKVAVSSLIHPHHRQIVKTYLTPAGCEIVELPCNADGTTDLSSLESMDDVAAVALQSPNFFGCIEDLPRVKQLTEAQKALFITSFTESLAYGLLKNPGQCGADIVAGEGQSLGISQSFGGPGLGILSGSKKFIRDLPGRYVGQTRDKNGERGFVLTLSTREQHIRREKAGSNICSNNGLNAMTAGMFLAAAGKTGMRQLAQLNHDKAVFLKEEFQRAGFEIPFSRPFFNEFVVKTDKGFSKKREELKKNHNMVAGLALEPYYPELADHYLFCATEVFSRQAMETMVREVT